MIWNLDAGWLLSAISVVAMFGFMLGMALDGVMGDDGFGATGNMVIITAGFFIGVAAVNLWGIPLRDPTLATASGLGGAFATLFSLALMKGMITRLG